MSEPKNTMETHLKVKYGDLTDEQLAAIRAISAGSVRRNGFDAWFVLAGTQEELDQLCQTHNLIKM